MGWIDRIRLALEAATTTPDDGCPRCPLCGHTDTSFRRENGSLVCSRCAMVARAVPSA